MKIIVDKLGIIQAICETANSDKIIGYLDDKSLSIDFIREYQRGNLYGVYHDEDDELVYETKDGDICVMKGNSLIISEDGSVLFDISDESYIQNPEDHAYFIEENGIIEKLVLESNSAYNDSDVCYYQGERGALVTWKDYDGTENIQKSGFYYTSSFEEFQTDYLPQ